MSLVIQALRFDRQMTGRVVLQEPFIACGVLEWQTSKGFHLKSPATLPPSKSVRQSLAALNHEALISSLAIKFYLLPENPCFHLR